ncbi:hypothetical protein Tco_1083819, partial [Tanacetum coccineum]
MVLQLTDFTSEITDEELREFTSEYYIPFALHPVVPAASASIADFPEGKVGVYTRFFEFANQRVPLSLFMCNVLNYYRLHISQLHCIGAAKITNFEVNCRLLAINPTVHLFRAFYHTSWSNGWVSFSKRAGRLQCYTEKLDALRRWREMFFWVDDAMFPWEQAALVAQLRARFSSERSQSVRKGEEILLLKTQLTDAQAEAESSRSYAQNLAEEKMALLAKLEQERAKSADYKASCHWAVKYLEGGKNNHFAGLEEFRQRVEGLLEKQEEKLRKLSIEYDEELYPHMLSAIAERRWLISHGMRLAAMSTLESQEVKQSFGDVVKCALARGK